jgi:hypothetical protein
MYCQDKKTLRESTPDNSVAHLQEELIAVKLREAEANLSLKDLRQRVGELSQQWQRHLQVSEQRQIETYSTQNVMNAVRCEFYMENVMSTRNI